MDYYSTLTRNEASIHEKTWRKLKCKLLRKSQSEKATYHVISIVWHSGKRKTMETVRRRLMVSRGLEGRRDEEKEHRGFFRQWNYSTRHCNDGCMRAQLLQPCLSLCDPVDCSPPGSSVHGILQATILEWIAVLPPGDLPRDWTHISCSSCIAGRFFTAEPLGKPHNGGYMPLYIFSNLQSI